MSKDRARSLGVVALLPLVLAACARGEVEPPIPVPADTTDAGPVGEPIDLEPLPPDTVVADTVAPEHIPPEPIPPDTAEAPVDTLVERPADRVPVLPGAVLPRQRIVAFYGNPASVRMGILGELPPDEMLARLDHEVDAWRRADPRTPVRPALHMIAVMATGDPGADSLYRLRLPDWRIEQVVEWAERRNALVFLDIQPGQSHVSRELPRLEDWLSHPDVHLGLDPEWSMPPGVLPGERIGSVTAADINYAIAFLADLVERHDLPPKVLVVHRFTQNMIHNADEIGFDPRVQVVINMDGWGPPSQKIHAYRDIVAPEATQFTGFKLFFKNDVRGESRLMTPAEILSLDPPPVYIQYQ